LERKHDIDDAFFRAYSEPFATPEESGGVVAFPKSMIMGTFVPERGSTEQVEAVRAKPEIMIEGLRDKVLLAKYFIPLFENAFPGRPIHRLEGGGYFVLEDEPEKITELILDFTHNS
jgi:hypothetical protein